MHILVTGANRGIGLALARHLAADGHNVTGTARDPSEAGELGEVARVVALDAADESSIRSLPERLGAGPIDVLFNNAGLWSEARSAGELTFAEVERVMRPNAVAPSMIAHALLDRLREGDRKLIVNVSSQLGSIALAARKGGRQPAVYNASKAALNMFTACLAGELAEEGITCIAVHPGWVRTRMGGENAALSPEQSAERLAAFIERATPRDSGGLFNTDGQLMPY